MNKIKGKIVVVLGPTASGKTKLAVNLAKKFSGEIISADSRQVYTGLDIGSGKDLNEYGKIPYHLIDVVNPKKQFSLSSYQKLAYQKIDDILKRNKTPFLVGGSGLYLDSIILGLTLPAVLPDYKLRASLEKKSLKTLQALSLKLKIKLNNSDFHNPRRLIRQIEIAKTSSNKFLKNPKYQCLILGLGPDQKTLEQKIFKRLKIRLDQGLIKEVKKLKKHLTWKRLDDFGLEYRMVSQFLQNKLTRPELEEKLSKAIVNFAKRQTTWFRRGIYKNKIIWLKNKTQAQQLIKSYLAK